MTDAIILPSSQDLEAVLIERQRIEQERHPDIQLVDKIVLKNGPRSYKVASHWVFINRHTGEIHHQAIRLETFRKSRLGWIEEREHSITLQDDGDNEYTRLLHFIGSVCNKQLPEAPGNYLVVPMDGESAVSGIDESTLNQFLELSQKAGVDVLSRLVDWLGKTEQTEQVVSKLESLDAHDLQRLNTVIGLSSLKNALAIWKANSGNDNEEFWQQTLAQNSFVFSQVFSFPVIVIEDKAYVGGKGVSNRGGNIVDFLCANNLTANTALVEIKTPRARLLGQQYRGDIYNVSDEVSGAVVQVSNYKNSLLKSYYELANRTDTREDAFEAFDPKCLVIIGSVGSELTSRKQKKSFELFRMGLKDVQLITYDELFGKVEILVNLLEGNNVV